VPSAFAFGAFAAPVGFAGAATATDAFVMGMSVWKPESAGSNGARERVRVSRRRWGKPGKKVVLLREKNQEKKTNAGAGGPGERRSRAMPTLSALVRGAIRTLNDPVNIPRRRIEPKLHRTHLTTG
jgi:hypothetical protein